MLVISALIALAAACGDVGEDGDATNASPTPGATLAAASCTPARPASAGDARRTVASGGLDRTYVLHIPPAYDGATRAPLVLIFHGLALSGEFMLGYTRVDAAADEAGFIAVLPDGQGSPPFWNTGVEGAADDVAFIRDLLSALDRELCIDTARVYAGGFSNGGGMSQLLSCEMPDRIAAVALVASTRLACTPRTPLIAFHGTADPVQQFDGGLGPRAPDAPPAVHGALEPVRSSLSAWAAALGCDAAPVVSHPLPDVELSAYLGCSGGDGAVQLYALGGGGHTWPGGTGALDVLGPATPGVDATALMWEFFAALPRR